MPTFTWLFQATVYPYFDAQRNEYVRKIAALPPERQALAEKRARLALVNMEIYQTTGEEQLNLIEEEAELIIELEKG